LAYLPVRSEILLNLRSFRQQFRFSPGHDLQFIYGGALKVFVAAYRALDFWMLTQASAHGVRYCLGYNITGFQP